LNGRKIRSITPAATFERERALQREVDGEAGSAEDGEEARRLDAELLQRRKHGEDDDRILDEAREELLKGDVDTPGFAERLFGGARRPAGRQPADDEDRDGADDIEGVGGRDQDDLIDDFVRLFLHFPYTLPLVELTETI
jgi:hypothetical protein